MRLLAVLAACFLSGCGAESTPGIALKDMGSFHIGGREVEIKGKVVPDLQLTPGIPANVDPNGTLAVEQMYVQYFIPADTKGRLPLLLWHGAWLTAATYETTPDGREGWLIDPTQTIDGRFSCREIEPDDTRIAFAGLQLVQVGALAWPELDA